MIKITFFSKPKFYSYCLILLISSCAGAKICPDYSSIYQNDGKEAEGDLTAMKGRSFNGYLVWGKETGKKSYCVAKVIAQNESMTELRLMSSYHCLRTLTLDNMSLPSEDIKLHLALDVSEQHNKNLCQYKGFNVPIKNIASSNYLVNLRHKFEKIAEIKNIPVPLNPSRRVSDYKSLKSTDEPWLEAFRSAPIPATTEAVYPDEGPLMKSLCSTVNRDSSSTTDEKYKKILGAEEDRRFFAACYLYTDLAHVDLEIEPKVWSGFQTSCLRGSTETSKYELPNISMDMKKPLSAASWDEVLRRWQLSPGTPEGHSINDFLAALKENHKKHEKEYTGETNFYRFNNGTTDVKEDDIIASFRNINKLYIWTAFKKVGQGYYDFVKSSLQPQPPGAPSQVYHILAMIHNDWGFTIIYDKASIDITKGASGSLLATETEAKGTVKKGHILGALYSVEGKETAAAHASYGSPVPLGYINLPHLPIQEADDDLPLANNQSNESTSPSQTPPPATNGDEGTQPDPAAEETQSETRPQPRSQPHEYIEPKPGRETMQAVEVVVPPTGGAGSSNGTSPTGGTIHEEGGWIDEATGNQYNKNGELVCVASKP